MIVSDADLAAIIDRLLDRTRSGATTWDAWQDDPNELYAVSSKFRYYVSSKPPNAGIRYTLEVWQVVTGAPDEQISSVTRGRSDSIGAQLKVLFDTALEAAYAASTLKDSVLEDLS